MPELDYTNRPVSADETPETVIKVWEIAVSDGDYDYYLERGWQAMLDFVRNHMEAMLEAADLNDDLLKAGASVTVKLREMTRAEYDAVRED